MTDLPHRDDDRRFEEVLGRLDALVRRGHQDDEPPPPPPAVSEATIPVLTDVYEPVHEQVFNRSVVEPSLKDVDQVVSEMLPGVMALLEEALVQQIRQSLNLALDEAVAGLRPQIESRLRQHLAQALAKNENDQVEM